MSTLHRLFVTQKGNPKAKRMMWAAFVLHQDAEDFIERTQEFNPTWEFERVYGTNRQIYPAKRSV